MIRVTRSAVIDAPIERVWAVLRDFNSHTAWHPVVAESEIEGGEPSDQIGCVRRFTLRDGNHIREQLLALSDRDHVSTYCILDASVPLRRYVATLQLKRVTDGERTFWHWQSTFDAPPGRVDRVAPNVRRVAVLHVPEISANLALLRSTETASKALGITVIPAAVRNAGDVERVLSPFARERAGR